MKQQVWHLLCDDAKIRRNLGSSVAINEAYSDKKSSPEEFSFPSIESLCLDRLIPALEREGWKYEAVPRDARKPHHGLDGEGNDYTENLPGLDSYIGDKDRDLEAAVRNAEKRVKNINQHSGIRIIFTSPVHGKILSQELYEVGWNWSYPI